MTLSHRSALVAAALVSIACASRPVVPDPDAASPPPVITTGQQLVEAMHARYAGRYLSTLSFLQNNTLYSASGGEQRTHEH